MSDIIRYSLVIVIVYLTHVQQAVTGFGSTVIALPFVTILLGLKTAVPMLVLQAWALTSFVTIESRRNILWGEYFRILGFTLIGFPLGMVMAFRLPEDMLKWVLAGFMIFIGVHGIFTQCRDNDCPKEVAKRTRILSTILLPIGGVIHGAFGSGGLLAVIYATRVLPNKTEFRATLSAVWLTLGTLLIVRFLKAHEINAHVLQMTALVLPFTVIGTIMGNHWHYRINERLFRISIYAVLIVAGFALGLSVIVV